jgi:hypothetical protein
MKSSITVVGPRVLPNLVKCQRAGWHLGAALSFALLTNVCWAATVDFANPEVSIEAFVRMRGDSSGKDTVTYWKGSTFAVMPNEAPKRIFGFEGFNVARMIKQKDGSWRMLSREFAVYRDVKTHAILSTWSNPYSSETNTVFHVQNDPVNQSFGRKSADGKVFPMPFQLMGADVLLNFDIPLSYPNPIDPKLFPKAAGHATYAGSESFGFFSKRADFDSKKLTSVPVTISWSRTSPWLPWMQMGDRPGSLMFTAWGKKLGSTKDLPKDLVDFVKAYDAKYLSAPRDDVQPNATTWSEYKRMVLDKQ